MDRVCFLLNVKYKGSRETLLPDPALPETRKKRKWSSLPSVNTVKNTEETLLAGRCLCFMALSHLVFQMMSLSSPLSRWGKASTKANDMVQVAVGAQGWEVKQETVSTRRPRSGHSLHWRGSFLLLRRLVTPSGQLVGITLLRGATKTCSSLSRQGCSQHIILIGVLTN